MAEYYIEGKTGKWEVVMGLEVHAQVSSQAKLFSGASATFGGEPNNQVSFVDAGFPGMLPVINQYCVEQAVKTGFGLNAQINLNSVFDRKNYFYADLPNGYQISQYKQPIVGEGYLLVDLPDGTTKRIGIERLHLEQDAGKSMHDQHPSKSYIDLNRAGVALMEIVSRPDLRSPEEAALYLKKLRSILRYIGSCDGNMEEGSMRCDANVSVRKPGAELGTRCEIKNLNSVRFLYAAIEYEANRQVEILEDGGKIVQETRLFDSVKGETRSMRSKEDAHDYRYFPDPDLLPLELDAAWVKSLGDSLPELPDAKKARFISEYGLTPYDADVLVMEQERAAFFEIVAKGRDGKLAANWVITELLGRLNKDGKDLGDSPVKAENLGGLIARISDKTISNSLAKTVFGHMWDEGKTADAVIEEKGMKQVTDTGAIEKLVEAAIAANPAVIAEFRAGKERALGFIVGQVMKQSQGKANPGMVNEILAQKLKSA
jgi:aspartyl-tRNA(Asn)/glutamyl-tRNA(Gln) amidotransferase subunit B